VPLIVKDRDGKVLHEVPDASFLNELDLNRVDLSGQELEGIHVDGSDLRDADLSNANLYWAYAFRANFDGANLQNSKLNGAKLDEATFRGADLRGAYLSYDNLGGGPTLINADLTGALLDGADLTGCEYDDSTRFPEGFDPAARGMTWVNPNRIYIRHGSFAAIKMAPGYYDPDPDHPGSYLPVPDKNKQSGKG
jgi:hypothetical protein